MTPSNLTLSVRRIIISLISYNQPSSGLEKLHQGNRLLSHQQFLEEKGTYRMMKDQNKTTEEMAQEYTCS